jgi:hypothetical protein
MLEWFYRLAGAASGRRTSARPEELPSVALVR